MAIPFWDAAAIDADGTTPGIVSLVTQGPYPDEFSAWDTITLNGVRAPGICRIEGGKHIPYNYEAALGQVLGPSWFFGFDPVPFTMTITIWEPQQFKQFEELLPQLIPPTGPNPQPRAVQAEHPQLKLWGVSTMYVQGMSAVRFRQPPMQQIGDIEFQCYEWRPPESILKPLQIPGAPPQGQSPADPQRFVVQPPSQSGIGP